MNAVLPDPSAAAPSGPIKLRPPKRDIRAPRLVAPPGACDTHFHIYYPERVFPFRPDRRYTPTDATLEDYRRTQRALGFSRGVIVTGSANLDNEPTLAAIAAAGGSLKGLALVAADVADDELRRLAKAGMTGFRMSTVSVGGLPPSELMPLARRVADLGWHAEIHVHRVEEIFELAATLRALPIPYSLDRVAQLSAARGPGTAAFDGIRRLLAEDENAYLNLYGLYQLSREGPPHYADMVPVARALIAARPSAIIWGSNWPHPSTDIPMPDDADLLDVLLEAAPDPAVRQAILVDNPARLYGWND